MKKLALLAAVTMVSLSVLADKATVSLNNFDANVPIYYLKSGTLAPTGQNIFVQVWGGPVGGTLNPLVDSAGAAITIAMGAGGSGAGWFDVGAGVVPGVADNAQATFQLVAWHGASLATADSTAKSPTWNQATGSWNSAAVPPAPLGGPALNIPGGTWNTIVPVPEPSTILLSLLGAAALLIRRRK